ncbi:MAG: flavin reductase family protein [Alphaproteobacteria bacterium]|nr:flavin reductase family protein [Alphaproteobacteria bacterium]
MFYRTDQHHGLRHNPFNALVIPRPIGWISSLAPDGSANLAPYSFFNGVSYTPPQVMFSGGPRLAAPGEKAPKKDSVANIEATGDFVVNLATWALREAMNQTAIDAPPEVDEFDYAGLTRAPSELVKAPRVAESPVHLECEYVKSVELLADEGVEPNIIVIGKVVGVHISDSVLTDGVVDQTKLVPIGRLGGHDYVKVTDIFTMRRPTWG